ncbi:dipeptidyl-peptidase 7 [Acidobacteria bacterium Mor1]|nr:dipeptidyl-peptidase 7 [Acidobacteria bacterium Mor1]
MKRWLLLLSIFVCLPAMSDEGMWMPIQLPEIEDELRATGLEIDPASLSKLTEHPMAAVVDLGGCSASFVSPNGLIVTNHHCVYGSLQYLSTPEKNLLQDGFLAGDLDEELPIGPGSRVRVTVDVTDVTKKVRKGLDELDGAERYDRIERRRKEMVAACEEDDGHRCRLFSFYGGLQYYLVKQLELRDVRMVYAPALWIGRFGGDIDNWMWPRHTGDFSFYRAYVGADGKPADHAESNVPYKPKHFLKTSPEGVEDGGFVMVTGYPGSTGRYRLAAEVENTFTWSYPMRRKSFDRRLEIIEEHTKDRPDAKIKYASMVGGIQNANKNTQGMLDGYARSNMLERRRALEKELQAWIESSPEIRKKHESSLRDLEALIKEQQSTRERDRLLVALSRSTLASTAGTLYRMSREKELDDIDREPSYQERNWPRIKARMQRMDRRFDPRVDRALWHDAIVQYMELPADQRVPEFDKFLKLGKGVDGLEARLEKMYEKTRLDEQDHRLELLEATPKQLEASEDPFIQLAVALYDFRRAREAKQEAISGEFNALRPAYMETMLEFLRSKGRAVYPDANSSLRVTYGTVKGYSPRDGIVYEPFTRLEGIAEKFTGEEPFAPPAKQMELIDEGHHGRFSLDSIESVPVNFLSTVDTTGGNSGSPTLNSKAELIGLLFDGTYDSINSDWDFDERTTRAIHVDVRYMLWVMEHVDNAHHLLVELGVPASM